jgi:hypothetical protein
MASVASARKRGLPRQVGNVCRLRQTKRTEVFFMLLKFSAQDQSLCASWFFLKHARMLST